MALIIINILILMIYNIIDIKKILHNLQQNRYNEDNRYLKWISKNERIVFVRPIFLFILIFLLSYFGDINIILIISILFNIYLIISFRNYLKKFTNEKVIVEIGKTTNDLSDSISKDLRKRGMKFVGSTTIYAYLQAIGIIYSHDEECFLYHGNP